MEADYRIGIPMNGLDCVKLIKPFEELEVGTKGCIVHKYNEDDFEVEFFDSDDETIGVYTISKDYLEVYWSTNAASTK